MTKIEKKNELLLPEEVISAKIYIVNNQKVILDSDLALLYGIDTGVLNQAVKRNINRFPSDFMLKISKKEMKNQRSQFVIFDLKRKWDIHAFTEQGVAMLSSVLRSSRAVQVNIQIMRTFTKMREILLTNKDLRDKIEALESKYDGQFKDVFEAIHVLISESSKE